MAAYPSFFPKLNPLNLTAAMNASHFPFALPISPRLSELDALLRVFLSTVVSLAFVHTVVSRLPKKLPRLIATLPIVYLFFFLPWQLSSICFRTIAAFCLSWICNFKLLLFCFDSGPLLLHLHSLPHFVAFAALPVQVRLPESRPSKDQKCAEQHHHQHSFSGMTVLRVALGLSVMFLSLWALSTDYAQRRQALAVPPLYTLLMFSVLYIYLAVGTIPVSLCLGVEIEPQFDRPYVSTSLGDFWGHRWNLIVTATLRPAVYWPVRSACLRLLGSLPARLVATLATFLVSGLMHEMLLYCLTVEPPTWEWTGFFVLHGFLLTGELCLKRAVGPVALPRALKVALTLSLLYATAVWLFYPPVIRIGLNSKAIAEMRFALDVLLSRI
ncbi:probable long-chain-alcohol O-fatty-acyltransferase 1 [Nymphaea colorata]|nr:probable long-chain-alcohol O-fatty-acyltransferase 1 [Nymphaea colorata]